MHLPSTLAAFNLVGLALAAQDNGLGYMQCATAVVEDLSFPECSSSYKLDCFCAASAGKDIGEMKLSPSAEEVCSKNGVAPKDIPKYLCDDANVPVSPRRGSTPMVRLGSEADENDQDHESDREMQQTHKRATKPDSDSTSSEEEEEEEKTNRLLIPQAAPNAAPVFAHATEKVLYQVPSTTADCACESERAMPTDPVSDADADAESVPAKMGSSMAGASPTVTGTTEGETQTRTRIETETVARTADAENTNTAHAAMAPLPSGAVPSVSSKIVVVSSTVRAAATPTGADAARKHGPNQSQGEKFTGAAVGIEVVLSRVVVGVLGVVAGLGVL
ncbi:hypothetical protein P175DRAFT_0526634 [Aspergillus ochraceoroseus IBT 24754]|uniref:Extracellular membrane protein CFEM domain-containing protein n=1 Tax=Aspergillus ochraceoroseus IBT 24754 TaxID=1392256 RepID=A0A2T5LMV2_9EURO|nr:uncharacterized protein P175DRAFT_0526634 [Aspergillus ochraceoroseus IBT 24754]PTU17609.1 hypothetical protein P175DRAFT_0526634 [Aspergillus ochraceoroseus IBT 24754]